MMEDSKIVKNDEYALRSHSYTDLLQHYVGNMRRNARAKYWMKIIFYVIVMLILFGLSCIFIYSVKNTTMIIQGMMKSGKVSFNDTIPVLTPLISAFATIIVSIMKLPEIIAKYLFHPEEDKSAVQIVGAIQKYDLDMYPLEHNVDKKLDDTHSDSDSWNHQEFQDDEKSPSDKPTDGSGYGENGNQKSS